MKALRSTQIVDAHKKNAYLDCMTPEQCRAARGWLDWGQQELADAARVSLSTVRDFEKGRRVPIANNLTAIRAALEAKEIAFVGDERTLGITAPKSGRDSVPLIREKVD